MLAHSESWHFFLCCSKTELAHVFCYCCCCCEQCSRGQPSANQPWRINYYLLGVQQQVGIHKCICHSNNVYILYCSSSEAHCSALNRWTTCSSCSSRGLYILYIYKWINKNITIWERPRYRALPSFMHAHSQIIMDRCAPAILDIYTYNCTASVAALRINGNARITKIRSFSLR